ncbi:MAG: (deoxy)nucleoside triphosphate pyrophosphohydrolase [Opitutaceae bacterium]|jgi:8-oxo-dGTP diphosphatase|nr:(deoxy)nucleoside triphosphate pyrophosphohydrolase [Opitutaceae bacterium]
MEARPVVQVVCALIEDDQGRLLLAQRPAHKHLGGYWEFPGGKLEPDETAEAALHREIHEELGCRIELGPALSPVTHAYSTITICLRPFLARLAPASPPPEPREHAALRWVAEHELASLAIPEADAPILAEWRARRAAC